MVTKQIKPKSKDRLATEIRLLDAAEQIFSKHGFQGATTRMIAKKADVNVALITRYFDGKYGLMLKFIEKKAAECRIIIMDYPPQETLSAECISFAKQRIQFFITDINIFKIVMVQFLTDPKFLKKFRESLIIFESHPTFQARINTLLKKEKVTPKLSTKQIVEIIEDYIFSIVLSRFAIRSLACTVSMAISCRCRILSQRRH